MMAKLIRTSKSGNKWTPDDLLAYNIRVVHQDATTFFGVPVLSLPKNVDEEVLTAEDAAATQRVTIATPFFVPWSLGCRRPMTRSPPSMTASSNSSIHSNITVPRESGRVVRTRKDLVLLVCGRRHHAKTDVCIIDETPDILLIVLEDKRHLESFESPPSTGIQ